MPIRQSVTRIISRGITWAFIVLAVPGFPQAHAQNADTTATATLYAVPQGVTGVGASLNSGSNSQMPGCSPAVYSAMAASSMTAISNSQQISQNGRPPPGKILTGCISSILKLIDNMDVWSKTSVWSAGIAAAKQMVLQMAATLVCDEIQSQYNQLMAQVFNSLSFLNSLVPCNLLRSNFPFAGGGAPPNLCQTLSGMQVTIGVPYYGGNNTPLIGKLLQQVQ